MHQLALVDLSKHIENTAYNPIELLPCFSTERQETVFNKDNPINGQSVIISDVALENENFRINLNKDGTWTIDFWKIV